MARAEPIVSRIRQTLAHYDGKPPADAEELAREYAAAVDDVNRRLERCVTLIRQGLRSEAIHQAELAPPLLEEAAALEFPLRHKWVELCEEQGFGPVPEVNAAAVGEVDEAFPREQQLERLLRTHRRLAIGRAPLRSRIQVLRQLSQTDPENPVWGEDLAAFERARHKQIAVEAQAAAHKRDATALEALRGECREIWLEPPPATLTRSVDKLAADTRTTLALARLRELEDAIRAAHQRRDADTLADLLRQWMEAATRADRPIESLRSEPITAAEAWLEEAQRTAELDREHRHTLAALELALDNRTPADELERIWAKLEKLERPVPKVLRSRYEARMSERRLESSRRFRLMMAGAVGVVLLVGLGVGFFIQRQLATRNVRQWHTQIESAIKEERFAEATKLFDQLHAQDPATANLAEFQALRASLEREEQNEQGRRQRFAAAIEQAEAAGIEQPDQQALLRAGSLAKTDEEKLRVEKLRDRVLRVSLAAQRERDAAFSAALDDLRQRFTEVRGTDSAVPPEAREPLREIQLELGKLTGREGISPALQTSAQTLTASLNAVLASLAEREQRDLAVRQRVEQVRAAWPDPAKYAAQLELFAKQHPENSLTADFTRAVEAAAGWRAAAAWNAELAKLGDLRVKEHKRAETLDAALEAHANEHPAGPYAQALASYRDYLARAAASLDPANSVDQSDSDLGRLLANPLVSKLWTLTTKRGDRFYLADDTPPQTLGTTVILKYVATAQQAFGEERLAEQNLERSSFDSLTPAPAPQVRFADAARKQLRDPNQPWETRHLRLCQLLVKEPDIDPILRATLAQEFGRLSLERDWTEVPELAAWRDRFKDLDTNVDWMDPTNKDVRSTREAATQALKPLPDFDALARGLEAWEKQMRSALTPRRAVGVLWRNSDGSRELFPAVPDQANGRLEAVVADGEGWRFEAIGDLDASKPRWNAKAAEQPIGTVVYASRP